MVEPIPRVPVITLAKATPGFTWGAFLFPLDLSQFFRYDCFMYHDPRIENDFMVVPIDGGPIKFMTYNEYINSPEWRSRVNRYKDEAGWQCSECGNTQRITGHHKTYVNLGNEPPDDIEILCWPCHQKRH